METTDEFNAVDFEQRLTNLKDTQDSIQAMSQWCLKHRPNHKRVVSSWLNVLKQVKVEHRLILFYLANDVIQHSKRKNFEFVDSWGTTLQRATTMVRDEKVKNKIIRIFNIWEQRGIYNDEFLADLHDLLSINPTKKQQPVESDDEQVTIVSTNIRNCVRLEKETDRSFKSLTKTVLVDTENIHALKDRRHVEDVGNEIAEHSNKLDAYLKTLNTEIKARTIAIAVLEQTDAFYHNQRGEVKVVANAYRNFGNRIKTMKRKLDELCESLPSPIPSPDINAPSPEPDADFDLPDLGQGFDHSFLSKSNGFLGGRLPFDINDFKSESPKSDAQPIQVIGGSSSSSKGGLTDFNIDEFFKSIMPESSSSPYSSLGGILGGIVGPPQPVPPVSDYNTSMYNEQPTLNYGSHKSLQPQTDHYGNQNSYRPPPMPPAANPYSNQSQQPPPPVNSNSYNRGGQQQNVPFNQQYQQHGSYHPPPPPRARYPTNNSSNQHMPLAPPPLPPAFESGNLSEEYNPETWELDMTWNSTSSQDDAFDQTIDTPVSPPHFEREATNVLEFGLDSSGGSSAERKTSAVDVDHRRMPPKGGGTTPMGIAGNLDKPRAVDIDHRNLISLTGSPALVKKNTSPLLPAPLLPSPLLPSPLQPPNMWRGDTDYRQTPMAAPPPLPKDSQFGSSDVDYRLPPPKLVPKVPGQGLLPPPPPLEPPQLNKMNELLEIQKHLFGKGSPATSSPRPPSEPMTSPPKTPVEFLSPPPTPSRQTKTIKRSPAMRRGQNGRGDNVETIDMEMSDEDFELPDFDLPDLANAFEEDEIVTGDSSTSKENEGDRLAEAEQGDSNNELPDDEPPQQHGRPLHPPRPLFDNMNQFRTPPPFGNMQHQQQQPFVRPLLMTPNFRNQNQSSNQQGGGPRFWGGNHGNNQHNPHNRQSPPTKTWERSVRPNTFEMNTIKNVTSVEDVVAEDVAPGTSSPPRVVINPFKQQPAASDTAKSSPVAAATAAQTPSSTQPPSTQTTMNPTTPTPTSTPKRVNPFSQQPRFPVSDVENNTLLMTQRGGGSSGPRWQSPQVRPNFEPQLPEMDVGMFTPGGGPIFQQTSGINPMGFLSPMMRGGGGRGGGRGGSPYFRQQGPRGMGAGNNQRPIFRNAFRGNPRGGGMW